MKYSVIIPTFNRAEMVEQAIQSVLQQTFQDFELLIVDDGSTEPLQISITDGRLRIIHHAKNLGASAARNTGIRQANGELIAFLDSDDLWLPEKLKKQEEFMRNPVYDACVADYEYDTSEGFRIIHLRQPKSWIRELSMGCTQGPGSTLVVRRDVYETVGMYDETMKRHEDYDWLLRFVQKYNMGVVQTPLARVRLGSVPSGDIMQVANQTILNRYESIFMGMGWFAGSRAVGRRNLETAVFYSIEGNKPMAWKYLRDAMLKNPIQHPGMVYRVLENLVNVSLYPKIKQFWAAFVHPDS